MKDNGLPKEEYVIQAKGMLEVKRLAVELRGLFASTRSTFQLFLEVDELLLSLETQSSDFQSCKR